MICYNMSMKTNNKENTMTKPFSKQRLLEARIELLESILTDEQRLYLKKLEVRQFKQRLDKLAKQLEEV